MKTITKLIIGILIVTITFVLVANIKTSSKNLEKTLIVAPKQIEKDSTDEDNLNNAEYNKAAIFYDNKNYDDAKQILMSFVNANNKFAQAHFLLGKILEFQGLYTEMSTRYEQYIKMKPKGIHSNYAKLRLAQFNIRTALSSKDHNKALDLMKSAEQYLITLDQNDENVKIALAVVYINIDKDNKDYRDIIDKFEKSDVNSTTENKIRYNVLGLAYAKVREFDKASKMFESAVADEPNNKYAHNNLGFAYANIGVREQSKSKLDYFIKAKKHFQKALKLDSNYENALNNLEWVEHEIDIAKSVLR